jgi:hypothetical protein
MPQTYNVGSRSRFVNFVAWLFVAFGALACGWAVIQNAAHASWAVQLAGEKGLTGLLCRYLPWVFSSAIALSLAIVVCAFGLLRRVEWARRVFIALLVVAIGVVLSSLWLQQEFVHLLVDPALRGLTLSQQAAELFGGMLTAARLLAAAVTVVAGFALADIIRRLMSPAIRQEFA